MDRSIGWVNSRLNMEYAPKGSKAPEIVTIASKKEKLLAELAEIEKERQAHVEEKAKIEEEVNFPIGRTREELDAYRERREKEALDALSMANDPMFQNNTKENPAPTVEGTSNLEGINDDTIK